jgi:REP element-mobilizing transposase RayT
MAAKAATTTSPFVLRPQGIADTLNGMEPRTFKRWRNRLPHWEVEKGTYFITIRCHGSLPHAVQRRIKELKASLDQIESRSVEFDELQRQIFMTAEKYLDRGEGFAPFKDAQCCQTFAAELESIAVGWHVADWVIMPNHVHFVLLDNGSAISLSQALRKFKGRSARACNLALGRSGSFWQRDWFDRWMRSESELARTRRYIANNPVKAELVKEPIDYPWLRMTVDPP